MGSNNMVWVRVHQSLVRYRAFLKIVYPVPSQRPIFGICVRQTLVLGTLFALGFGQQRMKPKIFDKNSTFGIGKTVVRRGKNYIWFETVLLWFFIFRWDLNYNTHIYLILYNIIILIDYGFLKKGVKKKSFG